MLMCFARVLSREIPFGPKFNKIQLDACSIAFSRSCSPDVVSDGPGTESFLPPTNVFLYGEGTSGVLIRAGLLLEERLAGVVRFFDDLGLAGCDDLRDTDRFLVSSRSIKFSLANSKGCSRLSNWLKLDSTFALTEFNIYKKNRLCQEKGPVPFRYHKYV